MIKKCIFLGLCCVWNTDKSEAWVNIKLTSEIWLLFIQIHFTLMSKILFLCFIYCSVDCSFCPKTNVLSWMFFFLWHFYCECQLYCFIVTIFWQAILQPNLMPIVRFQSYNAISSKNIVQTYISCTSVLVWAAPVRQATFSAPCHLVG